MSVYVNITYLNGIPGLLKKMGCKLIIDDDNVNVSRFGKIKANISVKDIIQIEAKKETDFTPSEEKDKSVIGRAIVGGLLLGSLGAMVGGMSGVGKKTKKQATTTNNWFVLIAFDLDGVQNIAVFQVNALIFKERVANRIVNEIITKRQYILSKTKKVGDSLSNISDASIHENIGEINMKSNIATLKWFKKTWFLTILAIIPPFNPIGIFMLWKFRSDLSQLFKVGLTILGAIIFISLLTNDESSNPKLSDSQKSTSVSEGKRSIQPSEDITIKSKRQPSSKRESSSKKEVSSENEFKKHLVKSEIRTPIMRESWYRIDEKFGELIEKISSITETLYDSIGNEMEIRKLNFSGSLNSKVLYKYNNDFNKIEELHFDKYNHLKEKKAYSYNVSGNIIEYSEYDSYANLKHKLIYKYSSDTKLIEKLSYNFSGKLNSKSIYEYDSIGNNIKTISYEGDGSKAGEELYKYDYMGNKIEHLFSNRFSSGRSVFKFDSNNKNVEQIFYDSNGTYKNKSMYKYDSEANLIELIFYGQDKSPLSKNLYEYNLQNNIIESKGFRYEKKFDKFQWVLMSGIKYEYKDWITH